MKRLPFMTEQKLKKLPLGLTDFKKIITNSHIYIDKTELIYQLITGGEYYFLSRPRRFGKSLLVSILAELFSGNKKLFENLWIARSDYAWQKHPVIIIDFSRIDYSSNDRLEKSLLRRLHAIASQYNVTVPATESAKDYFNDLIEKVAINGKVVILIDEYDKPILDHLNNQTEAIARREILRNFYSVIKGADQYIKFVLLTGVSRFSKTSVFSGINNLSDISMDVRYATMLGYTHKELIDYFTPYLKRLSKTDKKPLAETVQDVISYYNGYQFAEKSERMVNPYSVMRCLDAQKFESYWFETGTPSFLIKLIETGNYPLDRLYQPIMSMDELGAFEPDNIKITALLYQAGYLTIKQYNEDTKDYTLDFPNYEVARAFNLLITSDFAKITNSQTRAYAQLIAQAFAQHDLEKLKTHLQSFFNEMPYNAHIKREFDLHIIMFAVFKLIGIEVDPEVTTSLGRADLVVSLPALVYVIELKFNKTAHEALAQIQDKKYYEKYLNTNKQITLIGINFDQSTKTVSLEWLTCA